MSIALDQYFARIGFSGPVKPDLLTLNALHAAHVAAIAFEGADPLLGRPVPLDLPSLEAKLVHGNRGGYCFEQNTLFKAVLEAIGFTVTGLGARVRWMSPPERPAEARAHMLLRVDIDGESYLADVGFGACLMDRALRLETDTEQRTAMGTFRIVERDGFLSLEARQPGGWRVMYLFDLQPQLPSDFDMGNWYAATNPAEPFIHILIMERLDHDRRHKMINNLYRVEARDGEVVSEEEIQTPEALEAVLDTVFRVRMPVPAEDLFRRISQPAS